MPPVAVTASSIDLGVTSADAGALIADTNAVSADHGEMLPAPGALTAAIVARDTAPGMSVARLVPLRESTLALVGTLVAVTLDTSSNDTPQGSTALGTGGAILIGLGPTTTMGQSLFPPAGWARTDEGAIEAGGNTGEVAHPVPKGGTPWEHFVIGLDGDFDQFRRKFPEPPRDEAEPKLGSEAAIDSQCSEDTASAYPLRSGFETMASPVRDIPASSDTMSDAPAPIGPIRRGGYSLRELPDPEGTSPLPISLSTVALGLVAGCTWLRRRRRERPV
jgi:hypothetical protein